MEDRHAFIRDKVVPFDPQASLTTSKFLKSARDISFQARSLGLAYEIWQDALKEGRLIFLGLAGALVPAGLRKLISFVIEKRMVDVVVSTGANLFHDLYETVGHAHYKCHPETEDTELREHRLDRMYDVLGDDLIYQQIDKIIATFASKLEARPYTTREFFHRFGLWLKDQAKTPGILTTAAAAGVPIYVPALGDSSYGLALAAHLHKLGGSILFDIVKDVREMGHLCGKAVSTSVIFLGGGTPKNFTQQAWVEAEFLGYEAPGHKYCVQITADAPHWGGLSGCTFEESQSWGKIDFKAEKITVYSDATIAFPLLVCGLTEREAWKTRKHIPRFDNGLDVAVRYD